MLWANFLHFYQPPTQTREITEKVTREAYRPIVQLLLAHPRGRITVNINGVLTEQLARWGGADVLAGLRALAERGQIEFTGSAKFHPILPLVPEAEIVRQIEKIALDTPGIIRVAAFAGLSGATRTQASNAAALFPVFEEPEVRLKKGLTAAVITGELADPAH